MTHHGTETDFEYTTLKRLEALGYRPVFGMELERPHEQVVLVDVLSAWLTSRYPELPEAALDQAVHIPIDFAPICIIIEMNVKYSPKTVLFCKRRQPCSSNLRSVISFHSSSLPR